MLLECFHSLLKSFSHCRGDALNNHLIVVFLPGLFPGQPEKAALSTRRSLLQNPDTPEEPENPAPPVP